MNVTDLNALLLLQEIGDRFVTSEPVTQLCMQPMWNTAPSATETIQESNMRMWSHLVAVIRTGALFSFNWDDIPHVKTSTPDGRDESLPPLPYPRMWVEVCGGDTEDYLFRDADGRVSFLYGWGLVEEIIGESWRVYQLIGDVELLRDHPTARAMSIARVRDYQILVHDGQVVCTMLEDERGIIEAMPKEEQLGQYAFQSAPVHLVNVLHLLGVQTAAAAFPRQQTRHFQRRHGFPVPTAYIVRIGSLGETHEPGRGDRVFTHRWIVRGHYRRDDGGKFHIAGKGQCAWVRPYVKGPEGAPWKGRPIYQVEGGTPSPPQP